MKRPPPPSPSGAEAPARAPQRPLGRPFPPGVSGNPGGRPRAVRELLDLARESVPEALAFAKRLLADEKADARVRLDAAKFLTAYGLGAAPKLPADGDEEAPSRNPAAPLSTDDLVAIVRALKPDSANGQGH